MKKVLKGGTVVGGSGSVRADVLIDGEKVAAVGTGEEMERLADEDTQIVDVEGCLLFPGFIDAHTHFDLHVAGTVTADDFATGTRAAVRGGTTTIVDFGTQYEGESLADGLRNWHEKADGKCSCDYGFHMSISDWNPSVSRELDDMMEAGITSFKLYMTYDTQVDDKTIFEILRRLKEVGGITGVHCENSGMIAALQAEAKAAGRMGVESHPATRPAAAEAEAIDRLLRLAEVVDIPVIVVHLTCREGYDVIMEARRRGQKVYAETCPQYLLMDDSLYGLAGMEGAKYVCAPPLRKQEDSACLWKALADGTIQTVSTDHCSFTTEQKALGKDDFTKIPNGCAGVENLYPYMLDAANAGKITFQQAVALCSTNPANIFGCDNKGSLVVGKDADIVIYDRNKDFTISVNNMHSDYDHTIWEGKKLHGYPVQTYLRGQLVYDNGDFVGKPGMGQYVKRSPRKK